MSYDPKINRLIIWVCFGTFYLMQFFREQWLLMLPSNFRVAALQVSHIYMCVPLLFGMWLFYGIRGVPGGLGLKLKPRKKSWLVFIFALPVLVQLILLPASDYQESILELLIWAVTISFFDELAYRGFLFGLLFRKDRRGFVPSAGIYALFKVPELLHSGTPFSQMLGLFSLSLLFGLLYAWLYVEWKYNLWVPIFLHILILFGQGISGPDRMPGVNPQVLLLLMAFVAVGVTLLYKQISGERFEIRSGNLWKG